MYCSNEAFLIYSQKRGARVGQHAVRGQKVDSLRQVEKIDRDDVLEALLAVNVHLDRCRATGRNIDLGGIHRDLSYMWHLLACEDLVREVRPSVSRSPVLHLQDILSPFFELVEDFGFDGFDPVIAIAPDLAVGVAENLPSLKVLDPESR